MCLAAFAWMPHPRYRLVVAANRDEFHDRPTASLAWWQDDPRILAGRDGKASGTWMGVDASGRFGLLTNFRDFEAPAPDAPSRGGLVADYLRGHESPRDFLKTLGASSSRYAGFNLLIGGDDSLYYYSNRVDGGARELSPGVYGLSNHRLDSPWPKLTRTRRRLWELLAGPDVAAADLVDMLADRTRAEATSMPETGLPAEWESVLSAPFVQHERYGTRCSTLLLLATDGHAVMMEKRFDPAGTETGRTRIQFDAKAGSQEPRGLPVSRRSQTDEAAGDDSPE
jgi:uncharacterized protein with NRDE domain